NPNTAFAATGNDQPNIIVIMPDDIGWYNIGAYNDGIMAGITPNIDKIGQDGMRFTDYYADPSCTAGRASFITGELPIRTGLTTVGQAGAAVGMPDEAPTIAAVLKSMGYSTGQFGKNHLGDLNQFLPTVHGFDEFFGYLYHLDALEDPFTRTYPQEQNLIIGPRNMIHSWASDVDDNTVEPRWGKIGKQVIEDAGTLPPKRMENLDSEILDHTINFMEKSIDEDKPFFVWLNPSRMHVITHLNEHYDSTRTPENGWSVYEAGMLEVDDTVGKVMNYLEEKGIKDNTIVVFTTDNGAEVFTWPDGGMTPFRGAKGQIFEGGMRVPMLVQWPAQIPSGIVENQMMSGLDWLPTLVAAAGNPNIVEELKDGKSINGKTYNVHLDGYNQLDMLTGQGPSNRDVVYYFAEANLGAVRVGDYKYRFIDQPNGWFGETVSIGWPVVTNLRLDPFERAGLPDGDQGSIAYYNYFVTEFWRFVEAQQQVGELAQSFIDYPPMQDPASFNLDSVKKKIQKMRSLGD
ncbi:MAG: arylsulfatase, partial [Nitrosopumilus sp.]|nr:arylsulfatase [Nitrosopumilus sp.]MDH3833974.1 arylsulfatase [Nitrosopumilus sp.]